jgi:bacterioferritin
VTGNPEVIAAFQKALSALWSLATEYHLCKRVLKHKSLKGLGHKLAEFGEMCEAESQDVIDQILFLGGHPQIDSVSAKDEYTSLADIFESLLTKEESTLTEFQNDYAAMLAAKDTDSAHDIKDIIHRVEKRINWLEIQIANIADLGDVAYQTAKIK